MLVLGRVLAPYGVRGWVRIFSETEPRDNILSYQPWYLGEGCRPCRIAEARRHGKGLVAKLEGCEDRAQAAALVGQEIAIRRDQLPPTGTEEFYWADLEGMSVETLEGISLGRVEHLLATATNDVMLVAGDRKRLLPFLWGQVVRDVNLELARIRVDWDPDF